MSNHVTGITAQATSKFQLVEKGTQVEESVKETIKEVVKQQKIQTPEEFSVKEEISKEAGLDIGTLNIISARQRNGKVETKRIRNVFIDLSLEQVKMLKLSKDTSYVMKDEKCYVIGDDAANIANIFGRPLRTPMHKGVISPGELEAMEMLKIMIGEVLGEAPEGGICTVSSPGNPVDSDFDTVFHEAVIRGIVEDYGWEVETTSEAHAMIFSECFDANFSGLALSFGHGMVNLDLSFKSISCLSFSTSRSGSWIDDNAAKSTGKTSGQICAIKEKGIDLLDLSGSREEQAIKIYYKHLIQYTIKNFIQKFKELKGNIDLPENIKCVVAGGTSLPKGFIDLVKQSINKEKGFPIPVNEVKHAQDPLNSISKGLLIMSQNR